MIGALKASILYNIVKIVFCAHMEYFENKGEKNRGEIWCK